MLKKYNKKIGARRPVSILDVAKILYIADKNHFNDYGRSIYGENYFAFPEGPVPITLKNYVDGNYTFFPILENHKNSFIVIDHNIECFIKPDMSKFSTSDVTAIDDAVDQVIVQQIDLHKDYLDRAWYMTPVHTVIDWVLISDVELTEEQIDDLHFTSRHSVY